MPSFGIAFECAATEGAGVGSEIPILPQVGMNVPPGDTALIRAEPFLLPVGCLRDRFSAIFAKGSRCGLRDHRMTAEMGLDTVGRKTKYVRNFPVPNSLQTELFDFRFFGFCHNKPLSENRFAGLTISPRKWTNMRVIKK